MYVLKIRINGFAVVVIVIHGFLCHHAFISLQPAAGPVIRRRHPATVFFCSSAQRIAAEQKLIEAKKMEMLGDDQQAINLYKECLKIDANNDAAYYSLAQIYLNAKQIPDAIDLCTTGRSNQS